jgi:hypothetical protein
MVVAQRGERGAGRRHRMWVPLPVRAASALGADATVARHEPRELRTGRSRGKRHDDATALDQELVVIEGREILVGVPQRLGVAVTRERDAVPPAAGTVDPRE